MTSAILLLGFLSAPLAVVAVMPQSAHYATGRELAVVPFGVLLGTVGVASLLEHAKRAVRLAAIVLLVAMPLQFASFLAHYRGAYQVASAAWFDPTNLGDVTEYVMSIEGAATPAVFLSDNLDDSGVRWRFHTWKHRRDDLWQRTRRLGAGENDLSHVAVGSLIVLPAFDPRVPEFLAHESSVADFVLDVSGSRSTVVLRKGVTRP